MATLEVSFHSLAFPAEPDTSVDYFSSEPAFLR